MRKEEVERMRELLVEAITTLCRSGMKYETGMRVEGLLGVTLDEEDVILVNVNKSYRIPSKDDSEEAEGSVEDRNKSENQKDSLSESVEDRLAMPQNVRERSDVKHTAENHSVKREPPDYDNDVNAKRLKAHYHTDDQDSRSYTSLVPQFNPDGLQTTSWAQNMPPDTVRGDNNKTSCSNTDNTFLPKEEAHSHLQKEARAYQSTPPPSASHNVKIEILSSGSESEDTGFNIDQSQFSEEHSALYGVPVDSQGTPIYDPAAMAFTSGSGAELGYADGSFQDNSSMGASPGAGKEGFHTCPLCHVTFKQEQELLHHTCPSNRNRKQSKGQNYMCPHCPYKSSRTFNVRRHMLQVHKDLVCATNAPS